MKMKLTKQQWVLGGLMMAGLAALLSDRLMFASAAEATEDTLGPSDPTATVIAAKSASRSPEAAVAARLKGLSSVTPTDGVRDLFAGPKPVIVEVVAPDPTTSDREQRWQHRMLSAVVIRTDGHSIAIVDGKVIAVGGMLDGYQLVRVAQGTATFADGAVQKVLHSGKMPEMVKSRTESLDK